MKKNILGVVVFLFITCMVQGQDIAKNAIGLRLAPPNPIGTEGFGPEITYQRVLGAANRLELYGSYRTNSVRNTYRVGGIFHWFNNPIVDNLSWFAGPGVGIGHIDFDGFLSDDFDFRRDTETFAFIAADFGVDYRFNFPLQVAFSIRPTLDFHDLEDAEDLEDVDIVSLNVGVSARYTF